MKKTVLVKNTEVENDFFEIKKPSFLGWTIIVIIVATISWYLFYLPFDTGEFGYYIVLIASLLFILSFIGWIVMRFFPKRILNFFIIKNLKYHFKQNEKNKKKIAKFLLRMIFGLRLDKDYLYFMKNERTILDFKNIRSFIRLFLVRGVYDMVFTSIGFSYVVIIIINSFIKTPLWCFGIAIFGPMLSPMIVIGFIPVLWIVEDLKIQILDVKKTVILDFSKKIRSGIIKKILGIAGILICFGYFTNLPPTVWEFLGIDQTNSLERYAAALTAVVLVLSLVFAIATILMVTYFFFEHKKIFLKIQSKTKDCMYKANINIKRVDERSHENNELEMKIQLFD